VQLFGTTVRSHGTNSCWLLVPHSGVAVDAPIGRSIPRTMIPTQVVVLILVSQNSISPYLRTLNMLKMIGKTRKIDIHTAGLTWSVETQNDMILVAATRGVGMPIT
jgi:hypothetical protein